MRTCVYNSNLGIAKTCPGTGFAIEEVRPNPARVGSRPNCGGLPGGAHGAWGKEVLVGMRVGSWDMVHLAEDVLVERGVEVGRDPARAPGNPQLRSHRLTQKTRAGVLIWSSGELWSGHTTSTPLFINEGWERWINRHALRGWNAELES